MLYPWVPAKRRAGAKRARLLLASVPAPSAAVAPSPALSCLENQHLPMGALFYSLLSPAVPQEGATETFLPPHPPMAQLALQYRPLDSLWPEWGEAQAPYPRVPPGCLPCCALGLVPAGLCLPPGRGFPPLQTRPSLSHARRRASLLLTDTSVLPGRQLLSDRA